MADFPAQIVATSRRAAHDAVRALAPTTRWATVTSVSPLRIRFDGAADPLATKPSTLIGGLTVGERVYVIQHQRRAVIIGRAGGGAASSPAPTGITLNAGWEIFAGTDSFVRSGGLVSTYWAFTYTGADISVPTSGDIGNQTIGTLPVPLRPAQETPLASGRSGRVGAFGLFPSGDLMLAAVGGSANITSGATFSCGGTYLSV